MKSGTVVVGTDLSPLANEAVRQATAWASARGAALAVVHVAPGEILRALDYLDDEERERLHESIRRGLEDVKAGRTVEASQVISKLRARAAGR